MSSQFGLTEGTMLKMLRNNVQFRNSGYHEGEDFIYKTLIPNIVEAIAANNEAILFELEKERTPKSNTE